MNFKMTDFQQSDAQTAGAVADYQRRENRLEHFENGQARPKATTSPRAGLSSFPNRMVVELGQFNKMVASTRSRFQLAPTFEARCQQAFDIANDLFGAAPTWVCFYREMLGGSGMIHEIFTDLGEFGRFLRTEQYHQVQLMLTALRSRDLPENDPNDPQRMITVRLPKSLHEAMCAEAGRLNISVNRLCISRMLQLLDPKMIPETHSKPRGRKPRMAGATSETPSNGCESLEAAKTETCSLPNSNPTSVGMN